MALCSSPSDSIRILDELIKEYIDVDLGQALILVQDALSLFQEKTDKRGEATVLPNIKLDLFESKSRSSLQ